MNHDKLIAMLNDLQAVIIDKDMPKELALQLLKDINIMRLKVVSDMLRTKQS